MEHGTIAVGRSHSRLEGREGEKDEERRVSIAIRKVPGAGGAAGGIGGSNGSPPPLSTPVPFLLLPPLLPAGDVQYARGQRHQPFRHC